MMSSAWAWRLHISLHSHTIGLGWLGWIYSHWQECDHLRHCGFGISVTSCVSSKTHLLLWFTSLAIKLLESCLNDSLWQWSNTYTCGYFTLWKTGVSMLASSTSLRLSQPAWAVGRTYIAKDFLLGLMQMWKHFFYSNITMKRMLHCVIYALHYYFAVILCGKRFSVTGLTTPYYTMCNVYACCHQFPMKYTAHTVADHTWQYHYTVWKENYQYSCARIIASLRFTLSVSLWYFD